MIRRTGPWALLLLAVGTVCLVLAGLGSMRADEPLASFEPRTRSAPERALPPEDYSEPDWSTASMRPPPVREGPAEAMRSVLTVLVVLAVIGALLLVAAIVHRAIVLAGRPPRAEASPADPAELTAAQAATALDDAVVQLTRTQRPADAVIAAWLALEEAIARAGIARLPAQTTQEFVVAVLAGLDLPRADLEAFARLYGRALFSGEPVTEQDRDTAIALLTGLSTSLRTPRGQGR